MYQPRITLEDWLHHRDLRFDPFWALDAAQDPRLHEYLVGHDIFNVVWGDDVAFAFAPPGGGKTALRVRLTQACWVGQRTNRPFPVSYSPAYRRAPQVEIPLDTHLADLSRAAAKQLLIALAYRPHWLFALDATDQRAVFRALDWNLPSPLATYLHRCQSAQTPAPLLGAAGPVSPPPDPPDPALLATFCDTLLGLALAENGARPAPAERWQQIVQVLLATLRFQAIYVLLDGIDSRPETWRQPAAALASIAGVLHQVPQWGAQRIYLKGFFPSDTQAAFEAAYPALADAAQLVTIQWTPDLLAEVIRKRLYAASDGLFNSLNALGSPALPRHVEHVLAQHVVPLPREILVLTRAVLTAHIARVHDLNAPLEPDAIDAALHDYADNLPLADAAIPPLFAEDNNDA